VWEQHLADLQELMRRGLGRGPRPSAAKAPPAPAWLANAGPNFARNAKVSVATSKDAALHPPALLTDGVADLADNKGRWLSSNQPPHEIELTFDQPRAVGAARVISGYADDGQVVAPLRAFTFQWLDGQTWRDIPGAGAAANADPAWSATFAPVTTTRLRLRVTGADGGIARIWELEVYGPRGIGVPPM